MYKRVLLKLSGEALGIKDSSNIIDVESLHSICEKIKILHDDGMEVAIVIGALIYMFLARLHKEQEIFMQDSLVFQKVQLNE